MLELHRASRADRLAARLAEVLAVPAGDPFVAEVVSVPTRGVERWLSQQLATVLGARPGRGDGVCANVEFPFPAAVVGAALAAATGVDSEADPWKPERVVWPLLDVVDESLGEPWLQPLASYLGGPRPSEDRRDRRFGMVRHLADLFDRYEVHRPGLIRDWAAGEAASVGEAGAAWEADAAWQAELWRRLRERIGMPSPAERITGACRRLVEAPELVDLPARVSLFGLTRLPAAHLQVLAALGANRAVHLWLLHPSAVLWDRLAATGATVGPRRLDPTRALADNPLLRTWGRDAREMQLTLAAVGATGGEALPDPEPEPTLLGLVQSDIRADVDPPWPLPDTDSRPLLDPGDTSLQVHACHGRSRQVEVLREAILHLLEADPTLEQRDVIVMCPDIEAFAPLIQATFGPGAELDGAGLRVRLADRSLRQTNPVLGALARLLELAGGRVTASALLDLAGLAPLRAKFGLDDDDLARLDGWVRDSGVRWGFDQDWRRRYLLHEVPDGTWSAGLDRLLAGVAVSEDPLVLCDGVLPFDDMDSGDIDLVGRLAEFVSRARLVLTRLAQPHDLAGWVAAIQEAADLLLGTAPADEWQRLQLQRILDEVLVSAGAGGGLPVGAGGGPPGAAGGSGVPDAGAGPSGAGGSGAEEPAPAGPRLRPAEVRALLGDRLRGVPTRANFRTGHLTMCTLVPMRSVPHRVVCLLGLDDGVFPRQTRTDGDDLLAAEPWVGDRDPRSEERQLLLDAVLAARQHLVITYSGRDERTNARRPPAVPVGELLDLVDRTVRAPGGPAREAVVIEHPLQPFDERNLVPGTLAGDEPWSFDPADLAGALAARRRAGDADGGFPLLPPVQPDVVALDDLVRFVEHPVRAFLRQRLGVSVRGELVEPDDALPVELDALETWQVGDRLLSACLAGVSPVVAAGAELARGSLPPGRLGRRVLDGLLPGVEALVEAASAPAPTPVAVDVTVALPGGLPAVTGTVTEVFGDELRTVTYSRLGPQQRMAAWVRLLALSASRPDVAWRAMTVGRARRGDAVAVAQVGPLGDGDEARQAIAAGHLAVLVDLYLRGMREPLPLARRTSEAWAAAARAGKDAEEAARREWESSYDFPKEDDDAPHRLVHDGRLPWEAFVAAGPAAGEAGPGWDETQTTRAGRLAMRLWSGLLDVERIQ